VAGVLPAGSALIEFSTFLHLPKSSGSESSASGSPPIRYIAAVILSGDAQPKIVAFAAKGGIDELIVRVRDGMRNGSAVHDDLRKLHDLIWVPLAPSLGDSRRIFISPSGELNFLSFAALVTPERRYLGEEFTLSYVASGRDLLRHPAMDGTGAAIFADPDFSAIPVPGGAWVADVPGASGSGAAYHFLFGQGGRLVAAGMKFPNLSSTRTEAESLRRIFTAAGHAPDVWLGVDATKARVRALRRPAIVHFATHGFFLPAVGGMTGRFLAAGGETDASGESSLFRSGLALAGAAAALTGTAGDEGILTAGEAASLDLRGTRLVVLSACDSGAGDLAGDEVIGFRRAFVQAGVGDMLLALWPVEDRTTAGIMRGFYEYYLRGLPADLALARAQRDGMAVRRSAGGRLHPRFWAPFVVSFQGSPRPE
jgi:CHAT domain-containing protein